PWLPGSRFGRARAASWPLHPPVLFPGAGSRPSEEIISFPGKIGQARGRLVGKPGTRPEIGEREVAKRTPDKQTRLHAINRAPAVVQKLHDDDLLAVGGAAKFGPSFKHLSRRTPRSYRRTCPA